MKTDWVNKADVEGYIYSVDKLEKKTDKNGTDYIRGTVNVAVDADGMTVIPVRFIYETEFSKNGKPKKNYKALANIIAKVENGTLKTFTNSQQDAERIAIQCTIGLNEWPTEDGNYISNKCFVGKWINDSRGDFKNSFSADMLITNVADKASSEGECYAEIMGYVFDDFRTDVIYPLSFSVSNPSGMSYFMNAEISEATPMLTNVSGRIENKTIVKKETVESAWGDPEVTETSRSFRVWEVFSSSANPYEFGDDNVLDAEQFKRKLEVREAKIAADKARRNGGNSFPVENAPAPAQNYNNYNF